MIQKAQEEALTDDKTLQTVLLKLFFHHGLLNPEFLQQRSDENQLELDLNVDRHATERGLSGAEL